MRLSHFLFLFLLIGFKSAFARRLNYIEAHNLRLSSQTHPTHWMNPFVFNKNPKTVEANIFVSGHKDIKDVYDDVTSKDQQKIEDRLAKSFGNPYDLEAKVGFGFRSGNFSQFISTNGGAVLLVTDPVFPDLKGFLYHDYTMTSAYLFKPSRALVIKPQVSYGVRRVLDRTYSVGDLVDQGLDVKFDKVPYVGFVEAGLLATYNTFGYGHFLFELTSLPLISYEYQYWDTFIGYKTPNFAKYLNMKEGEVSFYGGYSPLYAGKYDVDRTFKTGLRVVPWKMLSLDVFTIDKFYPGALLGLSLSNFELSLFTLERAYDDFGKQKSRQYGLNLKFLW